MVKVQKEYKGTYGKILGIWQEEELAFELQIRRECEANSQTRQHLGSEASGAQVLAFAKAKPYVTAEDTSIGV